MGEYRATMNLGGHKRGQVLSLDDNDPVTVRRVEAGWIVRTDIVASKSEAPVRRSKARKAKPSTDTSDEAVEATTEADSAPTEDDTPTEESSVQTAWYVSPTSTD